MPRCSVSLPLIPLLLVAASFAEAQPAPFAVAIVRDDGVLIPLTTHDRGRWRMPWPGPQKEADVPVRIEDCPLAWWGLPTPPREWTLHVRDEPPRTIAVDRPVWVLSYCQQQVALGSRAAARAWWRPAEGLRTPKHGVAVTGGDPAMVLPREVPVDSPEARALLGHLQRPFNNEEHLMLAGDAFRTYAPSVDGRQRDRMAVRALNIQAGPGPDGEIYFVEVERRYPRRGPERLAWCDEVTYMVGWARRGADNQWVLSLLERAVTSCLLDSVARGTAHAIFRTAKGPVWLIEAYGPRQEGYGLYEAPSDERVRPLAYRSVGACAPGAEPVSRHVAGQDVSAAVP